MTSKSCGSNNMLTSFTGSITTLSAFYLARSTGTDVIRATRDRSANKNIPQIRRAPKRNNGRSGESLLKPTMGLNDRPVFMKNVNKGRQVGVISSHKRNPIRLNPLGISDSIGSSNTTGFLYTLLYHPKVIAPLGKMINQLVTSTFERLIIRADSTKSKGLAVGYISGKVFRMAAPGMQIHMGISWFRIQISDNIPAISKADLDIKKIYFNLRLLTRELNVRV